MTAPVADAQDPAASYAVGLLHDVERGSGIVEYLTKIDATLADYGGRFVVHGGESVVVEGTVDSDLIVIEFPEPDGATRWYHSDAYQRLARLRQTFARGAVVLCAGTEPGHRAIDILHEPHG
ncbi:MAG: DUF1330 domain-containing protein [Janthinobacterium lividum]